MDVASLLLFLTRPLFKTFSIVPYFHSGTCSLGSEMVGVECKKCLDGYYRNSSDQTFCIPCPVGMTTYGKGNKNGVCKGKNSQRSSNTILCEKTLSNVRYGTKYMIIETLS